MATQQRVEQLQTYCDQWQKTLEDAEARRDQLIEWQKQGTYIFTSDSNEDLFPTLIQEADNAVKMYKKILIKMESVRDLAMSGEDV